MEFHPRRTAGAGQKIGLWLGLIFFVLLLLFPVDPSNGQASRMAAVALLMATWWLRVELPTTPKRPNRPATKSAACRSVLV